MKDKKILPVVLTLAVFLQVSLSQVALPNLVLCFGENGHFAFEFQEKQEACEHSSLVNLPLLGMDTVHKRTHDMECSDINLHIHPSYAYNAFVKKTERVFDSGSVTAINLNGPVNGAEIKIPFYRNNPLSFTPQFQQNTILLI